MTGGLVKGFHAIRSGGIMVGYEALRSSFTLLHSNECGCATVTCTAGEWESEYHFAGNCNTAPFA